MLAKDSGLMQSAADEIVSEYSQSELDSLVEYYIEAYDGANLSYTEALEEILCDAYAGINIFEGTDIASELGGYGAAKYSGEVRGAAFDSNQSSQDDSGGVKLSRNTYDEYASNAMQWANSAGTKQGDTKALLTRSGWALVIADANSDGGYRIAKKGTYAEVKQIESAYREENESFDRNAEIYQPIKRRYNSNMRQSSNRGVRGQNSGSVDREQTKVEGNTTSRNDEHLRTPNNSTSTKLSRDLDGYVATGNKAVMTNERIDYLIADSGSTSPNYAHKWITSINPTDFINLTTGKWQDRAKFDTLPGDYGSTVNEYDYIEGLKKEKRQTPYIALDESGQVRGHEGRHRMRALEKQGITKAEIVVEFCYDDGYINKNYNSDGKRLQTVDSITVENQMGTGQTVELNNIIPLNNDHKAEILSAYGEQTANEGDIKYSRESATIEELKKENERLRKRLKDARRETKINPQAEFDEKSMNKFARGLLKAYDSKLKYKTKEVKRC